MITMLKVQSCLEDFSTLLHKVCRNMKEETELMRKQLKQKEEVEVLEKNVTTLETFQEISLYAMQEYLDGKINLIKAFLHEE